MTLDDLLVKIGFKADTKGLDNIGKKLDGIGRQLKFLSTVEVVKGLFALGQQFSGAALHMEQAAYNAGVSTEALQKLGYAAAQSGVQTESITGALQTLNKQLFEARKGSKSAQEAFAIAGFTAEQVDSFKDSSDAFKALANNIQATDDPMRRQAMLTGLLGDASANMTMLLSKGSKGLDDMGKHAQAVGAIMRGGDVKALANLEKTLMTLGTLFKSIAGTLAAAFAPALSMMVNRVMLLWGANRKLLSASFDKWVYNVTYALGFLFGVFEGLTKKVLRFAAAHPELTAKMATLATAATALAVGLGALGMVFRPLAAVFAVLTSPMAVLVAGLTAVAVVAHDLWTVFFEGGNIADTWIFKGTKALAELINDATKAMGLGELINTSADPDAEAKKIRQTGVDNAKPFTDAINSAASFMGKGPVFDANGAMTLFSNRNAAPGGSPAAAAAAGAKVDYKVNAPITINVPPGTDPKKAPEYARKGVEDSMIRMLRNTQDNLASGMAY